MRKKHNTPEQPFLIRKGSVSKRQIKRFIGQKPTDKIIVAPIGETGNEYAVLKLNFTNQELTEGRLVVIMYDGRPFACYYFREGSRVRLENYNGRKHVTLDADEVKIAAVVMRVDRVGIQRDASCPARL